LFGQPHRVTRRLRGTSPRKRRHSPHAPQTGELTNRTLIRLIGHLTPSDGRRPSSFPLKKHALYSLLPWNRPSAHNRANLLASMTHSLRRKSKIPASLPSSPLADPRSRRPYFLNSPPAQSPPFWFGPDSDSASRVIVDAGGYQALTLLTSLFRWPPRGPTIFSANK